MQQTLLELDIKQQTWTKYKYAPMMYFNISLFLFALDLQNTLGSTHVPGLETKSRTVDIFLNSTALNVKNTFG